MAAGRVNRFYLLAAAFGLAGVLALSPVPPAAVPEVHVPAVDLTAAEFPAFPDPASLSYTEYIDTVSQSFTLFAGHVQTVLQSLYADLNTVWTDFDSTMAGGMGAWNEAFTDLGANLSYWTTDIMDPTVKDLLETMNPSVGAVSLCNVLTFAVEGLQAQFNLLDSTTHDFSQQVIDEMNNFFALITAGM